MALKPGRKVSLRGSSFFAYESDVPLCLIAAACVTFARLAYGHIHSLFSCLTFSNAKDSMLKPFPYLVDRWASNCLN